MLLRGMAPPLLGWMSSDSFDGIDPVESLDGAHQLGQLLEVRDVGEKPRAVRGEHAQGHRAFEVAVHIPLYLDPALRISGQRFFAPHLVHGDAPTTSDETSDRVARHRVAEPAESHQNVVLTANLTT